MEATKQRINRQDKSQDKGEEEKMKCNNCNSQSFRPGSKSYTVKCNACNREQVKSVLQETK